MNKQKDYWVICKRNFFAMAILTALAFLFLLTVPSIPIFVFAIVIIVAIIWIVLGYMFNKKSPKAIEAAYIFLALGLLLNLANTFMNLSAFSISDVLAYLIYAYLFDCVRRAQKQSATLA